MGLVQLLPGVGLSGSRWCCYLFCTAMGATFPLAMAGIRGAFLQRESPRSFSYLYVANVLGAMAGTLVSAFLFIELMGFSRTVLVAAGLNAVVALGAFAVAARLGETRAPASEPAARGAASTNAAILPLLFISGLSSLAMEVVWTRQFVPFLGPVVYSFACMLAVYLAATAAGSRIYREWVQRAPIHRAGVAVLATGSFGGRCGAAGRGPDLTALVPRGEGFDCGRCPAGPG